MKTVTSQSTERPAEWDTESSPGTVYHNTDVTETPAAGDEPARFDYTQEQYTPEEYTAYLNDKRLAAIEENQTNIMLALVDAIEGGAAV